MNIALLVSGMLPSGKESLTITTMSFARQLQHNENFVAIVTRNKGNQQINEIPQINEINEIPFVKLRNFQFLPLYNKLLAFPLGFYKLQRRKQIKINIIHGFSSSPGLLLRSLLAKWLFSPKVKEIHTLRSYPIRKDLDKKNWNSFLSFLCAISYRLLNYADLVTVQTKCHARDLIRNKVNAEKIRVVRSHINLETFYPQNRDSLKLKYGYQNKLIVFNYGAMWEIKGTEYLIKSIPQVLRKLPSALFVFAPRNYEQALQMYKPLIKALNIERNVKFIAENIPIAEYVALADAVVLPYPHLEGTEGNPSCLLESLACGTPVITTQLPELQEVFFDCAIFVPPRNSSALAEAIIGVLTKKNEQLILSGLKKAKDFDLKLISQQFLELYASTLTYR